MASMNLLDLPPIPSEFKLIIPYLQRADELKSKEPIVAYWCAYYAAQLGISAKVRTMAARNLLLELLGTLEKMKKAYAADDIIDVESASAAYVENFALKVFGMADDEDRRGHATRSTAKKFLAAANFLEVLKVFPKTEISESNEDKIRYSKWKAADIAKAFREGRKPTPGPAGGEDQLTTADNFANSVPTVVSSAPSTSPPALKRSSPPLHLDPQQMSPNHLFVNAPGQGETTPGSWSTAATPGTGDSINGPSTEFTLEPELSDNHKQQHRRQGSGSSSEGSSSSRTHRSSISRKTATIGDINGNANALAPVFGESKKTVHFTPSVVGGEDSPTISVPNINTLPPSAPPIEFHPSEPSSFSDPDIVPSLPHIPDHYSPPQLTRIPLYPSSNPPPTHYSPPSIPIAPPPTDELTPSIIAKAQKHCRFAISALDYEDAEQARKELRAALKILGVD